MRPRNRAGLIRAIEDAGTGVETALTWPSCGQPGEQAVKVSQALSRHVEAIESILSLIRDNRRPANLLALNATIEAARAAMTAAASRVVPRK